MRTTFTTITANMGRHLACPQLVTTPGETSLCSYCCVIVRHCICCPAWFTYQPIPKTVRYIPSYYYHSRDNIYKDGSLYKFPIKSLFREFQSQDEIKLVNEWMIDLGRVQWGEGLILYNGIVTKKSKKWRISTCLSLGIYPIHRMT